MAADNSDVMLRNMYHALTECARYSSIFCGLFAVANPMGTKLEQPEICIADEHGQHYLRQPSKYHHRTEK